MRIDPSDRKRVEEAIQRAEAESGADFVCVLARSASDYEFYPLAWAALVSLCTPWLLMVATPWTVMTLLLAQLVTFAILLLLLGFTPLRHRLVPRRVRRAAAHRMATEQFVIRDLATTPHRRAVLLFLAEEERYARILADIGAEAVVPEGHWRATIDLLVDAAKNGRHADAFVAALDHCVTALRPTRPSEAGNRVNALSDRFIVLD